MLTLVMFSKKEDLKILKNNRSELVEATVKAICNYFGVTYKEKVSEEAKFDGSLYAVCVGAYKDKNKANSIAEELKKQGYTSTYLIIR